MLTKNILLHTFESHCQRWLSNNEQSGEYTWETVLLDVNEISPSRENYSKTFPRNYTKIVKNCVQLSIFQPNGEDHLSFLYWYRHPSCIKSRQHSWIRNSIFKWKSFPKIQILGQFFSNLHQNAFMHLYKRIRYDTANYDFMRAEIWRKQD